MIEKNPSSSPISLNIPQIQTTTAIPATTEESETHDMPQSLGTAGRLIMGVAEMILPETVMNMVTQFMQNTNGLVYSGSNIKFYISYTCICMKIWIDQDLLLVLIILIIYR